MATTKRSTLNLLAKNLAAAYDAQIDGMPFKKADKQSLKAGFRDGYGAAQQHLIAMLEVAIDEDAG